MDFQATPLARPGDWANWYHAFKGHATRLFVWNFIDPFTNGHLRRPELPTLPKELVNIPESDADAAEQERYQKALHHFSSVTVPNYNVQMDRYERDLESMQKMEDFFDRTVCKDTYGKVFALQQTLSGRLAMLYNEVEPDCEVGMHDGYFALEKVLSTNPAQTDFGKWSRQLRQSLTRCDGLNEWQPAAASKVRDELQTTFNQPMTECQSCTPTKDPQSDVGSVPALQSEPIKSWVLQAQQSLEAARSAPKWEEAPETDTETECGAEESPEPAAVAAADAAAEPAVENGPTASSSAKSSLSPTADPWVDDSPIGVDWQSANFDLLFDLADQTHWMRKGDLTLEQVMAEKKPHFRMFTPLRDRRLFDDPTTWDGDWLNYDLKLEEAKKTFKRCSYCGGRHVPADDRYDWESCEYCRPELCGVNDVDKVVGTRRSRAVHKKLAVQPKVFRQIATFRNRETLRAWYYQQRCSGTR